VAAEELRTPPETETTETQAEAAPISDDLLNAFENEASQASSEQMQRLFGKILAGEIRRPGSFSIRTIKLLSQPDNSAALTFHRLCSLSASLRTADRIFDARVISMGSAAANSLQPFGLSFDILYQPVVTLTLRHMSTELITRDFVIAKRVNVNADWY
jgi:hypothetical protein